MAVMTSRDARRVLDAVSELGGADSTGELRAATAKAAFDILPVDRAGWVSIDVASGELRGIHRPYQVDHLLAMIPRDLSAVPLVGPLRAQDDPRALRISDVLTRRQWHATGIWAEVYGPNGGEFQLAVRLEQRGTRLQALSFFRADADFTAREVAIVEEFGRHVRAAIGRFSRRRAAESALGVTARQLQALRAVEGGATVRQAALALGIAEKTMENHLQDAYRRLGVTNRIEALRRLPGAEL